MISFDFDDIAAWGPRLSQHLSAIVPDDAAAIISSGKPKFVEDAADLLYSAVASKEELIEAARGWVGLQIVAAYHGSRLSDAERASIRRNGLRILVASDREGHLSRKLSSHPRWKEAEPQLRHVIESLSERGKAGEREGQTHATLSRSGLMIGFPHYLTHGSEFDQHAANKLLGDECMKLLANYGNASLVTLAVPGEKALQAAHPFGPVGRGEIPNIIRDAIQAWSYWLADPSFSPAELKVDCGLMFFEDIPADWIRSIEIVDH
jgi:hypothetical protein